MTKRRRTMPKIGRVMKELGKVLVYCHRQYGRCDERGQCDLAEVNQAAKDAMELLERQNSAEHAVVVLKEHGWEEIRFPNGVLLRFGDTGGETMRWVISRVNSSYPFFDCKCSRCGYKTDSVLYGWKYCPGCGARMEEESHE